MSKHTPGPWVVDETWGLIMSGSAEIAACHAGRGGDSKANAALIAAAPEMLQTLQNIVKSAPFTGLPLALEKDIQTACTLIERLSK